MIFLAFIAGLVTSRWLESMLSRLLLKLPIGETAKTFVRRNAQGQEIDAKEKGKIISLEEIDARAALSKGGTLQEIVDSVYEE